MKQKYKIGDIIESLNAGKYLGEYKGIDKLVKIIINIENKIICE